MIVVKAVRISSAKDESLRILNEILSVSDRRSRIEVSPSKIAQKLGTTESTVRYNVKKFVALGYLRSIGNRYYEPTGEVLFLKQN